MNEKRPTPSDIHVAQRRQEERVEFLRRCAVEFAGYTILDELKHEHGHKLLKPEIARGLVADWGLLFDAIEEIRKG